MNKIEVADIPPDTLKWLENHIAAARWQTAKAANYPPELMHSYTMKHFDEKSRSACAALFKAIDEYGFDDDFFGQPHKYLIIGEYKYWHYIEIVNREPKNLAELRLQLRDQKKAEKAALKEAEDAKKPKQQSMF